MSDGEGTHGHELGLYFAASLPDAADLYAARDPFDGCDSEFDLTFYWQRPTRRIARPLVPALLREALAQPLPAHPRHVVHREA